MSTSAKVCDATTLQLRRDFKAERADEEIVASAVAPDGQTLATVGDDKKLRLWRISDGACQKTLAVKADVGRGMYSPLEFSPDGALLALGTRGPNLCLWDAQTGRELKVTRLGESAGTIGLVTFSPDGRFLACAGTSGPWVLDADKLLDERPK
jgi:WD40 repeat protein